MIKLKIDGKSIEVQSKKTIIEVADEVGIDIPRFCYHKKLTVAANCRMCLVQVKNIGKPLPACATQVMDGMEVSTKTKFTKEAQQSVMEFLLINHPLDCPICDQGGECELQDTAVAYGASESRYAEEKRVVVNKNIGPLISTDLTRCIQCTRCVRFLKEIGGVQELGLVGRGEHAEISAYVDKSVESELSGNIIDLCPVGALTSKPFRYKARTWELVRRPTISIHDSLGSNLEMHIKDDRVMRALPKENDAINECWISDRDRFSYEGFYHNDRLLEPMIKKNKKWLKVDWEEALLFIAKNINRSIAHEGQDSVAFLHSPQSSIEESYLIHKIADKIGTQNVDYRITQKNFDFSGTWLGCEISEIETLDQVIILGSNMRFDQPLLTHRFRKMVHQGGKLIFINALEHDLLIPLEKKIICKSQEYRTQLIQMLRAVYEIEPKKIINQDILAFIKKQKLNADTLQWMKQFVKGKNKKAIFLGQNALEANDASDLVFLANCLAESVSGLFGSLSNYPNGVGLDLIAHKQELKSTKDMMAKKISSLITLNIEPKYDIRANINLTDLIQKINFKVAITPYSGDAFDDFDCLLPMAIYTESSGSYINIARKLQSIKAITSPKGQSRPAWKILRVLGNYLNLDDFDYDSSEQVLCKVIHPKKRLAYPPLAAKKFNNKEKPLKKDGRNEIHPILPEQSDMIVRRAISLHCKKNKPLINIRQEVL